MRRYIPFSAVYQSDGASLMNTVWLGGSGSIGESSLVLGVSLIAVITFAILPTGKVEFAIDVVEDWLLGAAFRDGGAPSTWI
ncbi:MULTISPECIES: hypothetical protein [unclassified Cyanobium]|uniref:hypothetical protein n=1 Tax=unclassified Cyanobium TaxID=2627006 RepID=UPI0020CCE763|nr:MULTISPECIES: hypothetical protein [unclassified Cyanobium]MCP9835064.1 hypothetical protein [Cyanobium sp. La Preciosa 7G6]MCP9937827.1 hypothetical protein [Cyanobium sp. Aljojuca 7A6]